MLQQNSPTSFIPPTKPQFFLACPMATATRSSRRAHSSARSTRSTRKRTAVVDDSQELPEPEQQATAQKRPRRKRTAPSSSQANQPSEIKRGPPARRGAKAPSEPRSIESVKYNVDEDSEAVGSDGLIEQGLERMYYFRIVFPRSIANLPLL